MPSPSPFLSPWLCRRVVALHHALVPPRTVPGAKNLCHAQTNKGNHGSSPDHRFPCILLPERLHCIREYPHDKGISNAEQLVPSFSGPSWPFPPLCLSLCFARGMGWEQSSRPTRLRYPFHHLVWMGSVFTRTCTFALLWSVEGRHSLPPTLLSSPTSGKANNNHLLFFFYAAKGVRVCGPLRDIAHWNREAEKLRKVQKQPQTPAFPPKPLVLYTTQEDRGAVRTDTLPCFRRDCQKNAVLQRGVARTKGNYRQGDAERFPQGVEGG